MYDKTKKTWSQRLKIHKNEKSNGTAASSSTTTTTTAASSSSTTTTAAASTASTAKAKTATTTTTTRTTTTITPIASKNFNKYNNQQQQQLQQQQQQSAYYHRHQNQKQAPTSTYFDHNNVNVVTATIQQQQQQQQQQHKPQTSFHRQAITPKTTKTQVNAVMHLPVGLQMGYDYNAAAAAASAPNGGSNITTATATARTNRDYNFGTYTRTYTEPWIYSTVRGIPGHHYASTYYHGCYQNPFIATSATTSAPSPYSPHHQQQYHPNRYHPHPSHHQQALSSAIFATPTNSNVTTSAATPTAMAVVICSCTEYLHGTKKYRDMKKPIICKKCKGTRLPLANIGGPGINMGLGMGVGMGVGLEGGLNVPFPNNANVKLLRPIGTAATVRCVSTTKKLRPTILDPQRDPYDLMRRTRLLSPEPPIPITNHNKLFNKEHTNTPISTSMRERSRSRIPKPKMLMMMMLNGHMNNETNNDNNNENYLKQQIDSNWLNDMEKGDDIKSLPAPSTSSTPSPSATVPLASGSTTAAETRPTSNLRRSILGCNVNPYDLISTTTATTTLDDDNDYDHNNIDDTNTNDDDNNNNNNNSKLSQSSLKTRDIEQEQLDKMKFMKPKLNHKSNLILTDRVHKLCNNKKLSSSLSASSSSTSSTSLTPSFNNNKPNKNGQMKGQSEKSNVKQIQSQKSSKNKTLKVKEKDQGDGDDQDDEQRTNARKFENTSEMFVKDTQTIEQAIASTENQKNLIGNNNIKYNVDKEKSSENNSDNSSEETSFVEMNNTEFITVTVTPTHNIKSILKRPVTAATSATLNDVNGDNSKTNSIPMTATTAMPDHYENLDNNNVNASRTYENNLQNNTMATRMSATPTNTTKHLSSTASNNLAQQKQTRKKVQFMMDNKVITLSRNQLKQQQYEQYEGNYEAEDAEDKKNEETQKRKHDYRLANENDDEDDDNDANDSDDFDDSDDNDKTNCPSNYCDNDAVMTINYEYYNKKRNLHMQQLQREDSASSSSPEYYYSNNYELHNNGSNNNSSNNNYSDIVNDNSNEECVAYDKQFIQAMLLKKLQLDSKFVKEQHNNHSNEKAFNSTNLSKSNDNEISHSKDNSNDNDNYNDNDYDNDNYENFSSDNVLSSTFITTTYNSNEIADDNSHQMEELNNVMEDREEQLSKTIVNIEQKGNNNNYEVNDNNDKRNDNRTILQITSSNNHNSPPKEVKNCPGSNVKQAIHCFSMECLPSLDVSKDHFTKLKRSTSDRRGQLHHHNDNNNDKNVTMQKKEQQDHSHDLKKFIIALENPLAATEIKANGIKEEEQQQQKQHQQQKQKENNEESKENEKIEKIKESINNLTSTAASIKITTKMITTEPKILTANINNSNESNYNQNRYEYENENQQKNIKQNVYTTKVQSSSSTSTSTTPSTSSSSFLSSSLASSSNKPQRTVVRVAPFNQKPTEVHRLKITHTDGHLPYNPNHTLRTITNNNINNNNTNNSNHFTTVNPTTKSPSYYSYVSPSPSAKDFEQKKTSILINGDDDCYSTTNLGCDDTCTPLYQSSVVVNDTDVNRKGVIDLRIINQNGNAVTINVSGCNYQGQQQTQKPFMPTSPMSNKSVIPIGENMNQVNLQRSASTTSSASSASSIISLSSLSGSGSGSGIGSGNGNDSGSGSGSNSLLPKSNRTLIRLEPKDKDTSRNRKDTMGVEESAPPPSPSLSPSSTKLWLTHEEELLKILRNPIEAVKLNLVPHVCGRQNNDTNDTNNNNNSKKNDEIDLEKVSFASTNTTNVTTAATITTATTAHPMKSKGEHESFISKLLEDPMLRQVADGLETETILELIENSLRRLQEAKDCNNMNDSSKDTPNNIGNVNRLINISLKLIQEEKATLNLYNHQRNNNKIISDNHNDQILSHISTAIPTHNINTCKDDENLSNRGSISSTNSFASAHNYEIFDYNDNNESDCYQSCSSEIASFMEDESNTNLETRSKFYKMLVDATLAEIESTTNLKEEEEEAMGKMRMKKSSIEMADGNDDDESDENDDNDDDDDDNDEDDNDNEKNLNIHSEHDYESICFSGDPIYEEISEIPPPLPKSAPPLNDVEADKKMARSIFEGASKYDILSYLVDAKERGIVKEESLFENSTVSVSGDPPNSQIIIEEESLDTLSDLDKRLQKTKYGRIENMKNIENNDTQMDNTATPNHSLIILRNNKQTAASNDIERNDSGVGSETSKSSRSKYQGKQQQQHQNQHLNVTTGKEFCSSPLLHLCEDCDGHVDTQLTNDGILFASLVCRKCGKKRMERKEIITEIVETEEKYGRDLQIILEEFYQPMLVAGLLTQEQLSAIFLNTEELLENSQTLAERMRDALDIALEQGDDDLLTVNIGKIFLISTQMLHAFESYCVRQAAASLLLANLEKEKELLRIFLKVSQMENTVLRRMNLNSFLMVPVQRVTKYPLLLSRLHKVTPQHLDGRDQLKEAQEKIELHLNHINQEAKDVPMKLWRRISSSSPNRRVSYEIDMINIKLRKMAIDLLEWNHDEVRFVMEGKLLFTQPTDNNWKKARTIKLVQVNALLVTNGKPNVNYKVENSTSDRINFPKHTGIREASLLIIKEKCGRYTFIHEPLFLDKCLICSEADWDEYFEIQEISSKDTFIFKAEDSDRTKQWYTTLQYHAQGMGSWRKRRNALANIMINGMLTRS